MTFYTGDKFPRWKRNVFVGGLRQGEVPRTGQLQRIEFNEKWEEIRREPMLRELQQRIRDVRQGPDGLSLCADRRGSGGAAAHRTGGRGSIDAMSGPANAGHHVGWWWVVGGSWY